jgi:dipeptidyl-peptidase-4
VAASSTGPAGAAVIPLEDVARYPLPGMVQPGALAFSPDDRHLTVLHSPDRTLRRELWAHDVATGVVEVVAGASGGATEEDLSLEERLRRERQRELGVGVTRYAWAEAADRLAIPGTDGVEVVDGVAPGAPRRVLLTGLDHPVLDPALSPDGRLLGFVLDAEVHVVEVDGDAAHRPVTAGARGTGRTNGLAEFVAQEELDRARGWWWSPDGTAIAFAEVDETHIPVYRIVHQGADAVGPGAEEDHRYPFAGAANARVRLGAARVPAPGDDPAEPVWAALEGLADGYLARVDWCPDGTLVAQVLDRSQTRLELWRVDPATGAATSLLVEQSDVWVNVHDCFRPLPGGGFLWASERSGFRHLEVRAADGALVRTLTSGDWMVDDVVGTSPAGAADPTVWFTGTADGPTERHLYAVPLAGGELRRLTSGAGTHGVVVDHACTTFVDVHHALDAPPTVVLRSLADGAPVRAVFDDVDPRVAELGLEPPELTTVETRDGEVLHAALYRPAGEGPFPTIVSVYGGPHAQLVTDGWARTASLRAQHLRGLGYLVVAVDNRGSWGRGLAFEGALKHRLGDVEVRDQVDALRALAERGLVDLDRVGIYGWSYGGYLAAMCLARAPEVFSAAVAGAPVTEWDGYDTCYTERYLGTPEENPEGYAASAVTAHVEGIRGQLLLVHGLIDENVHFRHTARLLNALVRARIPSELVLFPDERHVPRSEPDRVFMEQRVVEFLTEHV